MTPGGECGRSTIFNRLSKRSGLLISHSKRINQVGERSIPAGLKKVRLPDRSIPAPPATPLTRLALDDVLSENQVPIAATRRGDWQIQ